MAMNLAATARLYRDEGLHFARCGTMVKDRNAGCWDDLNKIPANRPTLPHISAGQFTIQGMPNWSTHMPKPFAKKVLPNGMVTVPPSASALNLRSASAGFSTESETEKPCAALK